MKALILSMMMVCVSALAYAQSPTGVSKEDAIYMARHEAEIYNPAMPDKGMKAQAVYMTDQNAWLVSFVKEGSTDWSNPDYLVRVEATSLKNPEILIGAAQQEYQPYFKNVEETAPSEAAETPDGETGRQP